MQTSNFSATHRSGVVEGHAWGKALAVLLTAVLLIRIMQYSWVTDDAFITFRSVLNLVAGNGPVFNIGERVQSYTHPLWFLLLSVGGFLDLNLYFFAIFLGLIFCGLTVAMLWRINETLGNQSNYLGLTLSLGLLAGSESFVAFGTSGLENSATYFLVSLLIYLSLTPAQRTAFYLVFSLALINRLDSLFFLAPLFLWVVYRDWRAGRLRFLSTAIGLSPLVLWHAFSLVYYGFVFPNTKYAKVGGRSLSDNIVAGSSYLWDSIQAEWHVLVVVVLLAAFVLKGLRSGARSGAPQFLLRILMLGVLLHIVYVVAISGGDFMRGRFITLPTLGIAIGLLLVPLNIAGLRKGIFLIACGIAFGVSAYIGAAELRLGEPAAGVTNERNYYKEYLALNLNPVKNYNNHPWAMEGRGLHNTRGGVVGVNGQRGYWSPLEVNMVDEVALTDAFVARLPIVDSSRTGHFERDIPEEYLMEKAGHCRIDGWEDKAAEELREKIQIVTEKPELFSMARFKAMMWLWKRYGI
jgi:arabinofuranosyltransferase